MKVKLQQPQQNKNNIIPNPAWNNALDPAANQLDHEGYHREVPEFAMALRALKVLGPQVPKELSAPHIM